MVTAGMAEKAGHPVTFREYSRVAVIPTLLSVILATFWLLLVEL
ncbi:MAG: hypothetical protein V2A76_05045 [Planctomycetota bacterium]